MYYVYILKSLKDETHYIGSSAYIPTKRVIEHNQKMNKYTSKHIPYKLIWYGIFASKKLALQFEKYLKSGSGHAFMKKRLLPDGA